MGVGEVTVVYLCPRCLSAEARAGVCPNCGLERIGCRPGAGDDPCRKPLIDSAGQVRSRAPLWWLKHTVSQLAQYWEQR
jgi:hypothetical protein